MRPDDGQAQKGARATIDLDAAVQVIADALCDNNWHLGQDDARDFALVALDEIQRRSKEARIALDAEAARLRAVISEAALDLRGEGYTVWAERLEEGIAGGDDSWQTTYGEDPLGGSWS